MHDALRGNVSATRISRDGWWRTLLVGTALVVAVACRGSGKDARSFYKKTPGQPDKLVEIAKFTQVWKKGASGWKLARVLSYDHKLTE